MTAPRRVPLPEVREILDQRQVPAGLLRPPGPLTDEEFAELKAQFAEAVQHNRVTVLPPDVEVGGPALAGSRRRWFQHLRKGKIQG